VYLVDENDQVEVLQSIPQSSIGAPIPIILADEHLTIVAYYTQEDNNLDINEMDEPVAIVSFKRCYAHMFGPPNDEAFHGHPLASRGLRPYSFFLIKNSSWLRKLEQMNSVHPYHSSKLFEDYSHFVLSFHDSTFECIASSYEYEIVKAPLSKVIETMKSKLRR